MTRSSLSDGLLVGCARIMKKTLPLNGQLFLTGLLEGATPLAAIGVAGLPHTRCFAQTNTYFS